MKKEIKIVADCWQSVSQIFPKKLSFTLEKGGIRINTKELYDGIDKMIVTLDRVFWSVGEVKSFEYPKNWWEAFKLRFFPLWYLKLFPVTMTKIVIKEVIPKMPKKYHSKLYSYKTTKIVPKIELKDPEEYDFTFNKFNKE